MNLSRLLTVERSAVSRAGQEGPPIPLIESGLTAERRSGEGLWQLPSAPRIPARRQPLLSVIVLTFNGTPWLEACLRSLREQTLAEEFEIIVADNASSDSSSSLASQL